MQSSLGMALRHTWLRPVPKAPGDAMGGFYLIRYKVPEDNGYVEGIGALCFKRGFVSGVDSGGVRYDGTYTDSGRLLASILLEIPAGARLATGIKIDKPTQFALELSLPRDLHGKKQTIVLQGHPIELHFEKLLDLA
jgi:hypothetical protein